MKHSVLFGLFVTASMMASTSFADGKPADLCEANLQKIESAKTQYQTSPDLNSRVSASVSKARPSRLRAGSTTAWRKPSKPFW